MFSIQNAKDEYESLHIMKKDWFERGETDDIIAAITDLSRAICGRYPDSEFTWWFQTKWGGVGTGSSQIEN
jgi:hypothetical protein